MLLEASDEHGTDLKQSFVIGDRMMDIETAHAVGTEVVLVPNPEDQHNIEKDVHSYQSTLTIGRTVS